MENKNWLFTLLRDSTDLDPTDGEPTVFEWHNFTGHTTLQWRSEMQRTMSETNWVLQVQGSEHLHVDVQRHRLGQEERQRRFYCEFLDGAWFCSRITERTLVVPWSWSRRNVLRNAHLQTRWTVESDWLDMMTISSQSGHLVIRASCTLNHGALKSKGGGKLSIHHCGETALPLFRNFVSVNQPSIH